MPRNEAKPLSPSDRMVQVANHTVLASHVGDKVAVTYVKRNGEESSSTGVVEYFNGKPGYDTGSVTIDTRETKGRPTTVNLHNIRHIHTF